MSAVKVHLYSERTLKRDSIEMNWQDATDLDDFLRIHGYRVYPHFVVGDDEHAGFTNSILVRFFRHESGSPIIADLDLGDTGAELILFPHDLDVLDFLKEYADVWLLGRIQELTDSVREEYRWRDHIREMSGVKSRWYNHEDAQKRYYKRMTEQRAAAAKPSS